MSGFLTPGLDVDTVPVHRWMYAQTGLLLDAYARGWREAIDVLHVTGVPTKGPPEPLPIDTARQVIAKDHWYADWPDAMTHAHDLVHTGFELAADAIHAGDLGTLERLLDAQPELTRMRSPFPHHQTLLHHVAANGIEVERQLWSPPNAAKILRLLLDRGADPDALCESYGGGNGATTLYLLVSSAHPAAAGTQVPLVEELCRGGARVNGNDDDGLPLWTAVVYGYTKAAEALERCGARVDNLCLAAALGDLAAVRGYFAADGHLRPDVRPPERIGASGRRLDPQLVIEYALIWAAAHDRRPVVQFLLGKHPDLRVAEPCFHTTALGAARHFANIEIVALLEPLTPTGTPIR